VPADQAAVRRHNLSLVLRLLHERGPRSRAQIAADTGLTKATVSSLVADLAGRALVREGGVQMARTGRPGTLVEVDGRAVAAIGLELNVDYVAVLVTDLAGRVLQRRQRGIDARVSQRRALRAVTALAEQAVTAAEHSGAAVVGVTLAVPGLVDVASGVLRFAPNLAWRDVPLADHLADALGRAVPVHVDNDSNLGALAELRLGGHRHVRDLVYLVGEMGVRAGIVIDGEVLRGRAGFAGEVGHMVAVPDGAPCGCGAAGCFETVAGLEHLLRRAVPDVADELLASRLHPQVKVGVVADRAEVGDGQALAALEELGVWLGAGVATLVNLFDPEAVVLAGYFPAVAPWILPAVESTLRDRALVADVPGRRIVASSLGYAAATLGGALHAVERVLEDPTVVPPSLSLALSLAKEPS
jgi:predicted NBD/HSP70 family sugar kinase